MVAVRESLRESCGFPAGKRESMCGGSLPLRETRTPTHTPTIPQPASAGADRAAQAVCAVCRHVTRYGNCSEPVTAGLVEHFGLVRHPDDGRGCRAFAAQPGELERRLARLLALGAIDDADAALVRDRFDAYSPEEWSTLLDWCEAAARDATPACETEAPCCDRASRAPRDRSLPPAR